MDKPVITSGVTILSARSKMWCVRIGDQLKAATSIEELRKYLPNPSAKLGVWLESKYVDVDDINSYTWRTLRGFVDLDTGEFFKSVKKDFTDTNKFVGDNAVSKTESAIIVKIMEHMLDKWRKKFAREQKT